MFVVLTYVEVREKVKTGQSSGDIKSSIFMYAVLLMNNEKYILGGAFGSVHEKSGICDCEFI